MLRHSFRSGATWVLLGLGGIALSGCETFGNPVDIISGKRTKPDEFQVVARKPLRMPGTLELPEPRLGEESPLEPDPRSDAVIALLGGPVVSGGGAGGAGERELLEAAGAAAAQGESAAIIEEREAALDANETYEPPSIFEVFGSSDDESTEDALNPAAEARRLQREGIAPAPVDPTAVPAETPGEAQQGDDLFYDTTGRRPENRLPVPNTGTAF